MKKFIEEKYVLGMYVLQWRKVFQVTIFVEIMHNDAQVVELDVTTIFFINTQTLIPSWEG